MFPERVLNECAVKELAAPEYFNTVMTSYE